MTKRERESLIKKIAKIEERVAKKRDELRICTNDLEALIDSIKDADENTEGVLHNLRHAAESLEREVTDKLSEYV
jgi:uncharacterized membrane protein YvbJ